MTGSRTCHFSCRGLVSCTVQSATMYATRHPSIPTSNVDSEDNLVEISTAPTTPDGSLTFSPVLQALKLQDALEDAVHSRSKHISSSLDATMHSSRGGVKNICCVGAGYVGMRLFHFFANLHYSILGPESRHVIFGS